ncbi:hypothetical protein OO015_03230 [Thermomicrobium sp. 4228-Ro]|uniref:hypothetical protein n=1 Tax=Thermomicrobium sp. 4228-Ro TaxID=2993937 RepID=UPI0022487999|nr:hypothetical protein [Thermomicrobium sp. 4228-Ro]MCX2726505.1 hypothetical protein [Thermomicrobium sp. 4228-Ro]
MTQRRCGTCRYFEEGGLAGSGWCRHPKRQGLQHMVFVRRGELACRTGWDEDLWEPREHLDRTEAASVAGSWAWHSDRRSTEDLDTAFEPPVPPRWHATEPFDERPAAEPALDHARTGRSGETEPFPLLSEHTGDMAAPLDRVEEEPTTEPTLDDVSPDAQEILAALPRICRTCRDFRPSGDGRTGWCANPYAFPERRQVIADTLACASTLGSWWLPSDDWWLQHADISHHGQPTPHVDEFLRQLLSERLERRRRASS